MRDDAKSRILARRAAFIAASVAIVVLPSSSRAADAAVDDATASDADAEPQPCLSIAKEPEPEPCLCSMAPPDVAVPIEPALLTFAALTALSRRRRR